MSRGSADSIDIATYATKPRDAIVIGLPSFGMVSVYFLARYYNLRLPMNSIVRHVYVVGKEVGDARNEIIAKALAMEETDPTVRCKWIYFIDDDVLVHPDALLKLMSHNRPIVSGLYYTKSSMPTPLVLAGDSDGVIRSWTPGDVVECWAHGMGNTLIEADVFRRLQAETSLGVDSYGFPAWFKTTKDDLVVRPDGTKAIRNETEDVHFLRRAHGLGYQPAVDTGPQTFAFHYDSKSKRAFPLAQWDEFLSQGSITWAGPDGPVTWGAA